MFPDLMKSLLPLFSRLPVSACSSLESRLPFRTLPFSTPVLLSSSFHSPICASSHASSANPFAPPTPPTPVPPKAAHPPHFHFSRHPLRPSPLQPTHRLLRLVRSTHSHLMRPLKLATWFKRHVSVQSSQGPSIIFRRGSNRIPLA